MKLGDLFDHGLLGEMIAGGYVRAQQHPALPLTILNYTDKTAYDRVWNPVTRTCRGLIVNQITDEIVARPFPKFFNYGEIEAATLDLDGPVDVTDKADGSLGILYPVPGGWAVATRGSFTSEQAIHATNVWQNRYAATTRLPAGMTVLCEIIYPSNRIVLDYKGSDELVLLGCVDTETGRSYGHERVHYWAGPRIESFPYANLGEALAAEPRPNAEGLVVRFIATDERVKLKQDDYVMLHRIITTCTARRLWAFLAVNACPMPDGANPQYYATVLEMDPADAIRINAVGPDWMDTFLTGVPDEFYAWVKARVEEFTTAVDKLRTEITTIYEQMRAEIGSDRKAFAALARPHKYFGALFRLADGHAIDTYLWRAVTPEHETPFFSREDAA